MQQLQDPFVLLLFAADHLLQPQRPADDLIHRLPGIQRGHGVLKDHLQLPPHGKKLLIRHRSKVFAVVDHLSRRGLIQLQDRAAHRRLAAAGFSHQTEGPAPLDGEGNIVHRFQYAAIFAQALSPHGKMHLQALYIQ